MRAGFAIAIGTLIGMFLGACSTTEVPPATKEGVKPGESRRERELWKSAREQVLRLKHSGLLWKEKSVTGYLQSVADRVIPASVQKKKFKFEVYVLKDPNPNAFAFPDGRIFIHTGLLSRLDNEAQLAMILAHESVHATHRHILEHMGNLENKLAGLRWLGIATAPFGQVAQLGYVLAQIGTVAAIYGFSRDLEREADQTGFQFLTRTQYDVREAPELFKLLNLQLDTDRDQPPYLYATHPRNRERRKYLEELIQKTERSGGGKMFVERYINKTRIITLWNARKNIQRFWPETARYELKRLIRNGNTKPLVYFLLAKTYLNSENPDCSNALAHLKKAIDSGFNKPERYLLKGRILLRMGKANRARSAFTTYLKRVPDSPRKELLKTTIKKLKQDNEN